MESDCFVYAQIWQGLSALHLKAQYHYLYSNFQFPFMCEAFNRSGLGCERARTSLLSATNIPVYTFPLLLRGRERARAHTKKDSKRGGRAKIREEQRR